MVTCLKSHFSASVVSTFSFKARIACAVDFIVHPSFFDQHTFAGFVEVAGIVLLSTLTFFSHNPVASKEKTLSSKDIDVREQLRTFVNLFSRQA